MKLRVLFACGMAALFGACASDDTAKYPEASQNPREVSFRIHQELTTRAGKTDFEVGDCIGIYAVKHGTSEILACNVKWEYKEEGWEPATPADKVLWSQEGDAMDFYAYSPYSEEASDPLALELAVNVDVLRAGNAEGMSEGEVELFFTHAFSMVEVEITGEGIDFLPELALKANNVKVNSIWNIVEHTFTYAEDGDTAADFEAGDAECTFYLLLPPQEIAAEVPFLQCDNGGVTYIYTPAEAIKLNAGEKQQITITLK